MAGVANNWTQSDAGVAGHPAPLFTLSGKPTVSLVFLRLADGNSDGSGFSNDGFESLMKLWQGSIPTIHAVDGSASYAKGDLVSVLSGLMAAAQATEVRAQDYTAAFGSGDHADHLATAQFAYAAHRQYTTPHTFVGYLDYGSLGQARERLRADAECEAERILHLCAVQSG